jgi:hypothetical protein
MCDDVWRNDLFCTYFSIQLSCLREVCHGDMMHRLSEQLVSSVFFIKTEKRTNN